MPPMVSPETTVWTRSPADGWALGLGADCTGLACAGADGRGVEAAAPGTMSFWPGMISAPPLDSRFFSAMARTVVRWVMARFHRVSPGRTVTVFHEVVATGATAAWAGRASAATSAKGMGWSPFLEPEQVVRNVEGRSGKVARRWKWCVGLV